MTGNKGQSPEVEVIAANIEFYRDIARKYDEYESCVHNDNLQRMLRADLERMRGLLKSCAGNVRCLDCGGGSGNLSLKMLEMGWDVTIVDVSSDMLALLEERARTKGYSPTLVNSSVESYVSSTTDMYDVVTFNSVLHHLFSYIDVIEKVSDHIRPGGLFYSNFDPVISNGLFLPKLLESLDTIMAKVFHDRSDFLPGIARRARKLFRKSNQLHKRAVASSGDLAEYHARSGVNDLRIIALLEERDFSIMEYERWTGGRTWLARSLNNRLRLMETFKILARRSVGSDRERCLRV